MTPSNRARGCAEETAPRWVTERPVAASQTPYAGGEVQKVKGKMHDREHSQDLRSPTKQANPQGNQRATTLGASCPSEVRKYLS